MITDTLAHDPRTVLVTERGQRGRLTVWTVHTTRRGAVTGGFADRLGYVASPALPADVVEAAERAWNGRFI